MDNLTNVFVGVDVSKKFLDLHIFPLNRSFQIKNNFEGFNKLSQHLKSHEVEQVVCESSGGYEQKFLEFMNKNIKRGWLIQSE